MPRTKSAQKALRQNARRRSRNVNSRRSLNAKLKLFRKLVTQNKIDDARTMLKDVYQSLDKTAKKGILKKGTANRLKSRFARRVRQTRS